MMAGPDRRSTADRVYRALLPLYPAEFRQRFGADMVDFFRDRRRAAFRMSGTLGVVRVWIDALADLIGVASLERIDAIKRSMPPMHRSAPAHITTDSRNEDMLSSGRPRVWATRIACTQASR